MEAAAIAAAIAKEKAAEEEAKRMKELEDFMKEKKLTDKFLDQINEE